MNLVRTSFLAKGSNDYEFPRGAAQDNTHCPKFLAACKKICAKPSLLDLGCAGGGLVADFVGDGLEAAGIDGSDACFGRNNTEWDKLPQHFFNADIAKPFQMQDDQGKPLKFDVITAWEVLEHLDASGIAGCLLNIGRHLKQSGIFVGSISTIHDRVNGVEYHQTIENEAWWWRYFANHGLKVCDWREYFSRDQMPRGSGNPHAVGDWSGNEGFHIMATL